MLRHALSFSAFAFALTCALGTQARADDYYNVPHQSTTGSAGPVTVFLNRHGGTLRAGFDDGGAGTASLLAGLGIDELTVPAFRGSDRAWSGVVRCMRERLAPFDVDLVERRPAGGDYITMMIGGRPQMIGYPSSVSGIAPYSGGVIPSAIGFVFSDLLRNRPAAVCASTLHELGHTLGLDHAYHCQDAMSYLHGCGAKTFTDVDVRCGEYGARECADGARWQNSYRTLLANVGARGRQPAAPEPEPAPEPAPESEEPGWLPPPTIHQIEVATEWAGDGYRWVHVVSLAEAAGGIAEVELAWATPDGDYVFRCSEIPARAPVACVRDGGMTIFTLLVGRGERAFAVRVTAASGAQTATEPEWL